MRKKLFVWERLLRRLGPKRTPIQTKRLSLRNENLKQGTPDIPEFRQRRRDSIEGS